MVLLKRLDYGFNGYQVPAVPRGSRSARGRRGSFRKKDEDKQMCAFELLATVAGKLLQEKESSSGSSDTPFGKSTDAINKDNIKQELQHVETVVVPELGLQVHNQSCHSKDLSHARNDVGVGLLSDVDNVNEVRTCLEGDSTGYGKSCGVKAVDRIGRQIEAKPEKIDNLINGSCYSEDPMGLDTTKPPILVSSDTTFDVHKCRDNSISRVSFSAFPHDDKVTKVGFKDDDENSSGCTDPSTIHMKIVRPPQRIGDRRIKKLLTSKYWKAAPKLHDWERSRTDMKLNFHKRKTFYTRQRSHRNSSFKRRKLYGRSFLLTSEGGINSKGVCKSPNKGVTGDNANAGSRASSSVPGKKSSFTSSGSNGREVKLSIKSFRVPELVVEIPETATVGSLKRTVMEAVTAILGGGLRVGMVLKGTKVRDDSKTLAQTGISHDNKLDSLGFTLEPKPAHASPTKLSKDPSLLVPCGISQLSTRCLTSPNSNCGMSGTSMYPPMNNLGNFVGSDPDLELSPIDTSATKTTKDSRALVSIPSMTTDALTMVPLQMKSRLSDMVQRRTRRPFSVSEVEALVRAVEKLGTGRWREVKLCAFDNAKHRTYVDLKDKWKTLVHTARISPQQRRGEPVPQELLNRVLSAHGYWSKQQAKQQVKNEACLLL